MIFFFLRDQCRIRWLEKEDCNSFFYHATLKSRKVNKPLYSLIINGEIMTDLDCIAAYAVDFYVSLFSETNHSPTDFSIILEHVPTLVTDHNNACLISLLLEQEIRNIVFDMDPFSVPGPDGYIGISFRSCWPIVSNDFVLVVQQFFRTSKMFHGVNSNFIVLIPKVTQANKIEQFQPIVLGNFFFKLIIKILATRLGPISSRIIFSNQFSFVQSRQMGDYILEVSEYFNSLSNSNFDGHVTLKIDIRKAFDFIR
ncbi:hypothetical protein PanWU01x14_138650 [Parasponia andersonii]|uniref:Reverse transcriptase domain-containing protein n=1 Tax=Parasponia andersonii TaxID=3476 RepID=A0A2P5CMR4_PARAD|nr:hypothetical protein PanWU01x14_138650 [Parasponia andersonii]